MSSLDSTYGALQTGLLVATFLEGVLTLQCYVYYQMFPGDSKMTRYWVGLVWFLDTLHLGMVAALQYGYVITNYDNPAALANASWTFGVAIILTTFISLSVQGFFAWRTQIITRSYVPAGIIVALAFISFATGNACAGLSFHLVQYERFLHYRWLASIWLGCAAAGDIIISASLCWSFWHSRTGFKKTDNMLTTLTIWTINTGLLTSVVAIVDLICFVTMPNLIHFAFNVTLGKLYANMFVATLNQRILLRRGNQGTGLEIGSSHFTNGSRIGKAHNPRAVDVHVTSSTTQTSDDHGAIKMLPLNSYQSPKTNEEGYTTNYADGKNSMLTI